MSMFKYSVKEVILVGLSYLSPILPLYFKKKLVIYRYLKFYKHFPFKFVIAGGTLRDYFRGMGLNKEVDIDIFFETRKDIDDAICWINCRNGYGTYSYDENRGIGHFHVVGEYGIRDMDVVTYDNYKVFGCKTQFIFFKPLSSCKNIVNSFDFTVSAVGIDGKNLFFHEDFFKDLKSKTINIINLEGTLSTLTRIHKYTTKGFTYGKNILDMLVADMNNVCTNVFHSYNKYYDVYKICADLNIGIVCKIKRKKKV